MSELENYKKYKKSVENDSVKMVKEYEKTLIRDLFAQLSELQQKFFLKIYHIDNVNKFIPKHRKNVEFAINQMTSSIQGNTIIGASEKKKLIDERDNAREKLEKVLEQNKTLQEENQAIKDLQYEVNYLKNENKLYKEDTKISDYVYLKQRDMLLSALEVGGVDNWEWYGEAYQDYENKLGENNE